MISKEQALAQALNTVYEALFGLSREALLEQAKQHPHYGLAAGKIYEFGDEDESMRDCLSLEALTVLGEVEANLAPYLANMFIVSTRSLDAALQSLNRAVRDECERVKGKYGDFVIWYEAKK
jgi:hypothetical protein